MSRHTCKCSCKCLLFSSDTNQNWYVWHILANVCNIVFHNSEKSSQPLGGLQLPLLELLTYMMELAKLQTDSRNQWYAKRVVKLDDIQYWILLCNLYSFLFILLCYSNATYTSPVRSWLWTIYGSDGDFQKHVTRCNQIGGMFIPSHYSSNLNFMLVQQLLQMPLKANKHTPSLPLNAGTK